MSASVPVTVRAEEPGAANRLRYRQALTIALLFTGYAAYYFCRSDFSVAMPLLIEELGRHGVASSEAIVRLGSIVSFGVLAYALGKLFLTGLGDFWGGKRSFTIRLSLKTAASRWRSSTPPPAPARYFIGIT